MEQEGDGIRDVPQATRIDIASLEASGLGTER